MKTIVPVFILLALGGCCAGPGGIDPDALDPALPDTLDRFEAALDGTYDAGPEERAAHLTTARGLRLVFEQAQRARQAAESPSPTP